MRQTVCLLLLCFVCAFAQITADPTFPTLPLSYKTVVSANFDETGYSLSYSEWWDGENGFLRTQGRLLPYTTVEILSYQSQEMWQFDPADPVATCLKFNLTQVLARSPFMGPSSNWFTSSNFMNVSGLKYQGQSGEVRLLLTDVWTTTLDRNMTSRRDGFTYGSHMDLTFHFTVNDTVSNQGLPQAPVRVQLKGSYANFSAAPITSYTFEHYYDWVDFTPEYHNPGLFIPPISCTLADARTRVSLPEESTVLPPRTVNVTVPDVPGQFRLVVEAKMQEGITESGFSGTWNMDRLAGYERFDYLNDDWNEEIQVIIFDETKPSGGTQYVVDVDGVCTPSLLAVDSTSEAFNVRAGAIPDLFREPLYLYGATYMGQGMARGVNADLFKISKTKQNGQTSYAFDMWVYFYPEGWQFPGRTAAEAGVRLPMRVVNNGFYTTLHSSTRVWYQDTWDIFSLNPAAPAAHLFDVSQWNCGVLPVVDGDDEFPGFATQYETSVSANFDETGYTLAYTEYYDSVRGLLRTDGKFGTSNVTQLYDFNSQRLYAFNSHSTHPTSTASTVSGVPSQCQIFNISSTIISRSLWRPAVEFFNYAANLTDPLAVQNYAYMGTTYAARNILCDFWRSTNTYTFPNMTTMQFIGLYYFAVDYIPGALRVPIRVELTGSATSTIPLAPGVPIPAPVVFHHVYDFVDWVPSTPKTIKPYNLDPFVLPTDCVWADLNLYRHNLTRNSLFVTLPTVSTVVDNPTTPFPTLPVSFQMLLEAKLSDDNKEQLWALTWLVDASQSTERVSYKTTGYGEAQLVRWSHLYIYDTPFDYGTGEVYVMREDECGTGTDVSVANANPIGSLRAGFILALFRGTANLQPTFIGRRLARAVYCDVWRSTIVRQVSNITFSFVVDIYFYPEGWQFPGRLEVSPTMRIPMRIMTNGTSRAIGATSPVYYSDTWDIYKFIPVAPDASFFNPALLGCTVATTDVTVVTTATSKGPIIAIAALSSVAGLSILIAVIYYGRRVRKANAPDAPIQLAEITPGAVAAGNN